MPNPERKNVGGLEIEQDLRHQKREWTVERVAWILFALVLVAAVAGLLGPGPLSRATAGQPGSALQAEYRRFVRYQAPSRLKVILGPGAAAGTARLRISRRYLENLEMKRIDPEPESVEAGPEWFTYVFRVPDTSRPTAVTYSFQPDRFGRMTARIALEGGPGIAFGQFVYP